MCKAEASAALWPFPESFRASCVVSPGCGGLSNLFNWLPGLWATSVSSAADLQSSERRKKLRRVTGKCFSVCLSTVNPLHPTGTTLLLRTEPGAGKAKLRG